MGTREMYTALNDIAEERARQNELFGEQSYPAVESDMDWGYSKVASEYKYLYSQQKNKGELTWATILLEEVYEALAETDLLNQRKELVQVAAVAVAMIEDLDRKKDAYVGSR